jgi:hypothetical protein
MYRLLVYLHFNLLMFMPIGSSKYKYVGMLFLDLLKFECKNPEYTSAIRYHNIE